jgi:xanthine dehydrogenase accessory factor
MKGSGPWPGVQAGQFARHLSELVARHEPFAVATVTRTEGSTLAKPGFKILVSPKGEVVAGTLGGGCPEGPIVEAALEAIRAGDPRVLRIHLVDTEASISGTANAADPNEIWVQTNCGGTLEVYIEPMLPTQRLILVGQGGRDDLEAALVHGAKRLGFEVIVVDPTPNLPEPPDRVIASSHLDAQELPLHRHDSVIVLTKGERDVAVLEAISKSSVRFVGLLASRHRVKQDLDELAKRGVSEEFRRALRAPIGIDIGAKTPEELAVAILAEVVATRYGKDPAHPAGHSTS